MEIIETHAMPDHIHMLVRVPPKMSISSFMGYLKGRSAMLTHEQYANLKYKYGNKSLWSKGYYVSTVGLNPKTIEKYIREQEADNRIRDSISKREYVDPFKKWREVNERRWASGSLLNTPRRGHECCPLLGVLKIHPFSRVDELL